MLCISGNIDLSTLLQFHLKVRKVKQKKKRMLSLLTRFQIRNEFTTFQSGNQDQNLLMILFAQYLQETTDLLLEETQEKYLSFLSHTFNCLESLLWDANHQLWLLTTTAVSLPSSISMESWPSSTQKLVLQDQRFQDIIFLKKRKKFGRSFGLMMKTIYAQLWRRIDYL